MRIFTKEQLHNVVAITDLETIVPLVSKNEATNNLKKFSKEMWLDGVNLEETYEKIEDNASKFFRMMSLSRYTNCSFNYIVEHMDTIDLMDFLNKEGLHLSLDMSPFTYTSISDEDYRGLLMMSAKECELQAKTPVGAYYLFSLMKDNDLFYAPVYDLYFNNLDTITSGDESWKQIIMDFIRLHKAEMKGATISNLGDEYIMTNPVMRMGDAPTIKLLSKLTLLVVVVRLIHTNRIRMKNNTNPVYDIAYLI